jgi:colanic acid/amylovoran biosynthesis glycosyltransferase
VVHVVPEYLPRTATFIYTQLKFQHEYLPIVLTERTSNLDEFPLDAPVRELASRPRSDGVWSRVSRKFVDLDLAAYAAGIAAQALETQCVAIHAHFGWSGVASLAAQQRLGLPLLTTFYGLDLAARKRRLARRDYYAELFKRGTMFLCEGPAMGLTLQELGCPMSRIRVVRIGLDLSQFPFRPPKRGDRLVVMQGARLVEKKGVDLSVSAYAKAVGDLPPSELWIVGDGPLRAELEELARGTGVESIKFFGEVSHQDYRRLAAQASVFIQPSRTAKDGDTEGGAPTALIEMQAAGVPVVATRHADIPFVVAHQDLLVDEEDVIGLAKNLVAVANLGESDLTVRLRDARTFVEHYHDAGVIARSIAALYSEVREAA